MPLSRRRRRVALSCSALLGAGLLTSLSPVTASGAAPTPDGAAPAAEVNRIAEANGLSVAQTRAALDDPTVQVAATGQLMYVEPAAPEAASAPGAAPESASALPAAQAFLAHSKPDATRTIYLDFDGFTMAPDSIWVTTWEYPAGSWSGWDPGDDGPAFSTYERNQIITIWEQVAEDFAPWDVDVTTEDPGSAGLTRSDVDDTTYGTRVGITDNTAGQLCGSCGGVAPVNVYDAYSGGGMPVMDPGALVWPSSLGPDHRKFVAEAISHEVGHNLGLSHDGRAGEEYYEGNTLWAPIMGGSYMAPVSQWNDGSYPGANEHQDDLEIITGKLPVRTDEAGGTVATAAPLYSTDADWHISTSGDADTIRLGTCNGTVSLTADVAENTPNLDLQLELLDADGDVLASAAPTTTPVSFEVANGLAASLSSAVTPGVHYARVTGVGNGGWSSGSYDAYGSLGRYRVAVAGCSLVAPSAPGEPASVSVAYTGSGEAALSWTAPADDGGSAITGYQVQVDGGSFGPATTATSTTLTGLSAGSHTFSVRAVNGIGVGAPKQTTSLIPGGPGTVHLLTTAQPSSGTLTVDWAAPDTTGWGPVLDYRVQLTGQPDRTVTGTNVTYTGLTPGAELTVRVDARNGAGYGAEASTSVTVIAPGASPLAQPSTLTASRLGTGLTARLAWSPVATAERYQVQLPATGRSLETTGTSTTLAVPAGAHDIYVRAVRGLETSSWRAVRIEAVKVPGRVAKPSVKPGRAKKPTTVLLSWRAPTSTVSLTGYRVVATKLNARGKKVGSKVFNRTAGSTRFEVKLASANRWRFTVQARNVAGSGPASSASAAVKPR